MKRTSGAVTRVAASLVAFCGAVFVAASVGCASTDGRGDVATSTNSDTMPNGQGHESAQAPWRLLWNFADPVASEAAFRDALAAAKSAAAVGKARADASGSTELELETQIARALGLQRRFDEATALLDDVAARFEALHASARNGDRPDDRTGDRSDRTGERADSRVAVLLELERGRVLRSRGSPHAAPPHFLAAFEHARAAGLDYLAVDAAHMLGLVAPADEANAWNERALALAEASTDPLARGWAAAIANNQGWSAFDAGRHPEALAYFERALVLRRERPEQREPLWIARWSVARAWRALGRVEEALDEQRAILAERDGAVAPDGYVHEELGECLLALGRTHEARAHFAAASKALAQDTWLAANEPARLARLARLGAGGA